MKKLFFIATFIFLNYFVCGMDPSTEIWVDGRNEESWLRDLNLKSMDPVIIEILKFKLLNPESNLSLILQQHEKEDCAAESNKQDADNMREKRVKLREWRETLQRK